MNSKNNKTEVLFIRKNGNQNFSITDLICLKIHNEKSKMEMIFLIQFEWKFVNENI